MAKSKGRPKKQLDEDEDLKGKRRKDEPEEAEVEDAELTELDADEEKPQVKGRKGKTQMADAEELEAEELEATELDADEEKPQVKRRKSVDDEAEVEETELDADAEEAEVEAEPEEAEAAVKADDDEEFNLDATDDAEAEVEAEEEAEAEADADGGDKDDEEDEDEDDTPPAPRPKLTKTALVLILLNWIAAPAFLYFAYADHMVRVQHAHLTQLNYIQIWGLPLAEEEDGSILYADTRPRLKLTSEQLSEAFKKRRGVAHKDFVPVDEPVPLRLRPSDMTSLVLEDVFNKQSVTDPVATLDDEINRLKADVPAKIESAAKEVLASLKDDDAKKREVAEKAFYPLAWDGPQARKFEAAIAQAKGSDLDNLVLDGLQRKMYYDILGPLNVFRPGEIDDVKKYKIERLGDLEKFKLDDVKNFLQERLAAALADRHNLEVHMGEAAFNADSPGDAVKRNAIEKRQVIGFILFTLAHVTIPPAHDKLLYPKGLERAQVVCGLYEFTNASIHYVVARRTQNETRLKNTIADREGYVHNTKDGKLTSTAGFPENYDLYVDRVVKIAEHVDAAQKRLGELQKQRDDFQKIQDERKKHLQDTLDKLLKARKNTERYVKELHALQEQLHKALVELSDSGERNFQLEAEIRAIELGLMKAAPKGGKKQP